jgi:hypothetical protein
MTQLTAPEGKKAADACGRSSASGRAPPQESSSVRPPTRRASHTASPGTVRRNGKTPDLDAAFRAHIPLFGPARNPIGITGGEPP